MSKDENMREDIMKKYNFILETGDKNVGSVYLPDRDYGKLPVLIYSHGWGGNRSLGAVLKKLLDKNFALVTFDYYGCGDTGGDYSQMTYRRWKENLSDIIKWVIKQPFANPCKIGCFAFSSGSTAALRLAAEDDRIKTIISVGTCISTHIGMNSGGPAKLLTDNLNHLRDGGKTKIFGLEFPIEFYIDTISNAPIHTMQNIKCSTLFLQGTNDNVYRCADAKMGYELLRASNAITKHTEFRGGNHGLDNVAVDAAKAVIGWLEENLL
jgi:dipeptidyl aminopeptidase/acylaminoacyl peptidase